MESEETPAPTEDDDTTERAPQPGITPQEDPTPPEEEGEEQGEEEQGS